MHSTVADAVVGFAKTMGVQKLNFPESGIIKFTFEQVGTFIIEQKEEVTVAYLIRELSEYHLADKLEQALHLCHFKESQSFDIQAALHEGIHLIFLTCMTPKNITVPKIEETLNYLVKLHDKVQNNN